MRSGKRALRQAAAHPARDLRPLFRAVVTGLITNTNTLLLVGLKDRANEQVWSEFCSRYQPVLVAFGRRLGLKEADAEDAAQETLIAFADAYRKGLYDPARGRLRTWLFGIARHKICGTQRSDARRPVVQADEPTRLMDTVPDEATMTAAWELEWQRAIIDACLAHVRRDVEETTIRAFQLFVLQEWPADRVAAELGISRNAVFKAKRRVLSKMREIHRYLDANW